MDFWDVRHEGLTPVLTDATNGIAAARHIVGNTFPNGSPKIWNALFEYFYRKV
jgi:hypothetical protein